VSFLLLLPGPNAAVLLVVVYVVSDVDVINVAAAVHFFAGKSH